MSPFIVLLLFGFTLVTSQSVGAGSDAAVLSQIRFLLDEERSLRQNLETRVQALKAEAARLSGTIVPCTCPQMPDPPTPPSSVPVAYTGTLPATRSSLTTASVLNYTNDLVNIGQPFNSNTGHFVTPVSGIYELTLTMFMNPGSGYWSSMQLVLNGTPLTKIKTGHYRYSSTNRQINMATNSAVANLTAGDEVWPQFTGGSGRLYADGVSTFSGVLLHELP